MKLFDEHKRTITDPAKNNNNTYDYLNTSSRNEMTIIREKLEEWFKKYPTAEKFEIKRRLKSTNQFNSVFFEMYLHDLFLKMKFNVESHPSIKDSGSKPDLLLVKNNNILYVEAKVDYNSTEKRRREQNFKNRLLDNINNIKNEQYKIILEKIEILSENQPSIKKFKKHLENQFSELEYNDLKNRTQNGLVLLKSRCYLDSDLRIKYKIYAIDETYNGQRLIGIDASSNVEIIDSKSSLRSSLDKKRKKYEGMNAPFIIAINSLDIFLESCDINSLLFGSNHYEYFIHEKNESNLILKEHLDNGFFSSKDINQNSNVSAVLIYKNVSIGNFENPKYWFMENPNARYPLKPCQLSFRHSNFITKI